MPKRITIHAHPGSSKETITERSPGVLDVWVHATAVDNKANHAIIRVVARHFDTAPSTISVVRGSTSKTKILEID